MVPLTDMEVTAEVVPVVVAAIAVVDSAPEVDSTAEVVAMTVVAVVVVVVTVVGEEEEVMEEEEEVVTDPHVIYNNLRKTAQVTTFNSFTTVIAAC